MKATENLAGRALPEIAYAYEGRYWRPTISVYYTSTKEAVDLRIDGHADNSCYFRTAAQQIVALAGGPKEYTPPTVRTFPQFRGRLLAGTDSGANSAAILRPLAAIAVPLDNRRMQIDIARLLSEDRLPLGELAHRKGISLSRRQMPLPVPRI